MYDCDNLQNNMDNFMQILEQNAYRDCIPLKGTFELTARCNFRCNMCYVRLDEKQIQKQGRELTNEEWLEIARQAKEAGMLYLTLTGGEVFARPGFKELYLALSEMGFLIQILSNGYLIDERVMEWLREIPPYAMRFTLYGASNETYERVCGAKDGFDRVSHAVDLIKDAEIPFYLVSTIVKENVHELAEMQKFANKKNVEFRATLSIVKAVRGATQDAEAHRLDILTGYTETVEQMKQSGASRLFGHIKNPLDVCGSYRKSFWLTWNGNLQLCSFMEQPAVSLMNGNKFYEAWKLLLNQLEQIHMPKKCNDCKYEGFCSRCPGALAAECGDCSSVNDEFCSNAKRLYEAFWERKGEECR